MFEELSPAVFPIDNAPLTNRAWKPLYHAINKMVNQLGADGEITARDNLVGQVMAALEEIDGGVYQQDF